MGGGFERLREGAWRLPLGTQERGAAAAKPGGVGIIRVTLRALQIPFPLSGWPKHTEANQHGQAAKIIGFNPWISRLLKNPWGKLVAPDRQLMANAPGLPCASGKWIVSPEGGPA